MKKQTPKDLTPHLAMEHFHPPVPHTPAWYSLFGGKCPVCGVEAKHA